MSKTTTTPRTAPATVFNRAHQLRMLRVCYEAHNISEALSQSTALFPEITAGEIGVNPVTAVFAYCAALEKQINLMLSLIEGVEGIDYPVEENASEVEQ